MLKGACFPCLQIPEKYTPEYIQFLEDRLTSQRDKLVLMKEKNKMLSLEAELRNINLDIERQEAHAQALICCVYSLK